jgi:uncharacterized membrane protein (UPF0136 family)
VELQAQERRAQWSEGPTLMDVNIDYALALRMVPSNTPIYGPNGLTTIGAILPDGVPRVDPLGQQTPPTTKTKKPIPWLLIAGGGVLAFLLLRKKKES